MERNYAKEEADRQRSILWANAMNVAAQVNTASGAKPDEVFKWAEIFFRLSHAPYEQGGQWFNAESIGLKKVDLKTTVNIDDTKEMKAALQTQKEEW